MDIEQLVHKISKQADLTYDEEETLLHDINNLRADEWLDIIEECCTKKVIKEFKNLLNDEEN